MKFVKKPNLPESPVSLVAISSAAGEAKKKLNLLGINTLEVAPVNGLPEGIASHADLQLLHFGENEFFSASEHLFKGEREACFSVKKLNIELAGGYPKDVALNAAVIGKYLVYNPSTLAPEVLKRASELGMKLISVKQGYTKCSICVLSDSAIITDDKSICESAGKYLNEVVFIEKNSIALRGFNYGFIGGCCGKLSSKLLAVNGSIMSHSDHNKIIDALDRNGIEAVELKGGRLEDIGGILPITEKD